MSFKINFIQSIINQNRLTQPSHTRESVAPWYMLKIFLLIFGLSLSRDSTDATSFRYQWVRLRFSSLNLLNIPTNYLYSHFPPPRYLSIILFEYRTKSIYKFVTHSPLKFVNSQFYSNPPSSHFSLFIFLYYYYFFELIDSQLWSCIKSRETPRFLRRKFIVQIPLFTDPDVFLYISCKQENEMGSKGEVGFQFFI